MKKYRSSRIIASLCLALLPLLNEYAFAQGKLKEKLINLYLWNDYIDPKVLDDFTKETGIRVVYDSYENTERVEAKMLGQNSGYDIVLSSAPLLQRFATSNIFIPLDRAKLSNHKNLKGDILDRMKLIDPENKHAIPYLWGTIGLGLNITKIKERLGNDFPQSWDLLLDQKLASKLKDCTIHIMDSPNDIFPNILRAIKLDPNSKKPEDLQKAGDALFRIRGNVTRFDNVEAINGLANGSVCLSIGPSSDMSLAKQRAKKAGHNFEISSIIPREGALIWADSLAIPKDAPNVENAHVFLNYMLRPDVAAANSNFLDLAHANAAAGVFTKPENMNNPHLFPGNEIMQRLFITTPWDERIQRLAARMWQRVKTGK
jgi:putrescine transport system substrate-binding protein